MEDILSNIFWKNTVRDWLITMAGIFISIAIIRLLKLFAVNRLEKWAAKTNSNFDDFIVLQFSKTIIPLLQWIAVYYWLSLLVLNPGIKKWLGTAMLVATVFYAIKCITSAVRYFIERSLQGQENVEVKTKQARGIIIIINVAFWATGTIFLLNNSGYNVTSIVAGLGIGGIAIALAAQAILGDLFSYFVIFFDKPFEIGDFINVDDKTGTIEYIGLKTTRLRTLGGEQLIFSNHDLTNSRVHNYKRMEKRRVVFSIAVVYDTSLQKLQSIPIIIKNIIEKQEDISFDRSHFTGFGDFSLNFETVYYINNSDYVLFMNKQQSINFMILTKFLEEKIEFAYPTQTILLQGSDKPLSAPPNGNEIRRMASQ